MDPLMLFALTSEQLREIGADPWKWWTFHYSAVGSLKYHGPVLVALLIGVVAAAVKRRRHPALARRVFLGCLLLALVHVIWVFAEWVWTVLDPDPVFPYRPVNRPAINWTLYGLCEAIQMAGLWVLVSAVVRGRATTPSEGQE